MVTNETFCGRFAPDHATLYIGGGINAVWLGALLYIVGM
jgi:hypothetical protein